MLPCSPPLPLSREKYEKKKHRSLTLHADNMKEKQEKKQRIVPWKTRGSKLLRAI